MKPITSSVPLKCAPVCDGIFCAVTHKRTLPYVVAQSWSPVFLERWANIKQTFYFLYFTLEYFVTATESNSDTWHAKLRCGAHGRTGWGCRFRSPQGEEVIEGQMCKFRRETWWEPDTEKWGSERRWNSEFKMREEKLIECDWSQLCLQTRDELYWEMAHTRWCLCV